MQPSNELEEDMIQDLIDDPNITVVNIADLSFTRLLGQGGYASVFLAQWKSRGISVAVKQLKMDLLAATATSDINSRAEFIHEIRLMSTLNHPNILTLLGVCYSENMLLLTEYMDFGSLAQVLCVVLMWVGVMRVCV
jgi:serine/threonine protein kinase